MYRWQNGLVSKLHKAVGKVFFNCTTRKENVLKTQCTYEQVLRKEHGIVTNQRTEKLHGKLQLHKSFIMCFVVMHNGNKCHDYAVKVS